MKIKDLVEEEERLTKLIDATRQGLWGVRNLILLAKDRPTIQMNNTCEHCGAVKDVCIVCGKPFRRNSHNQIVCAAKDGKRTCYWKYRYNKDVYLNKPLDKSAGIN